ncbi:uncharacterized protein LOC127131228 [Lathyrus oleraceus]|uniref:uncharacterized protein LOC127131228 n=1 Tax=Pisum sativum TaxID=3888 RepID=UPI0021D2AC9C|nr:uncharacterized protein LOC127131228 [Pisum sativum]
MDGVLVINEIIDFAVRNKRECRLVKVDFATNYDCVLWEYLSYMLGRINFGLRWFRWMDMLVFSSSMLVLINGSPSLDFDMGRDLCQGDPLSRFLFLIAAEGLSGLMKNGIRLDKFHRFKFNEDVHFKLIQFPNDMVLICDGYSDNLWIVKALSLGFELAFRL